MSEITRVVLDAMGGDYAPTEMVKGAVDAINRERRVKVILVGREESIKNELEKYTFDKERIQIVNTPEACQERGSGRFCFSGKFRCDTGRRTDVGRTNQGSRETAACAAYSDG